MKNLRVARLPRRLLGMSVDVLACAVPVWLMLRTDVLSRAAFNPEPGWFHSEWLLKLWLDHPPLLTAPLLWWVIFGLLWQVVWELTLRRTPGAMLVGIAPVHRHTGAPISRVQALTRALGSVLNLATLGLGYVLCFIFREGRALHELMSQSVTACGAKRAARSDA